jgi:putative ABC transport system ATP-binding protein
VSTGTGREAIVTARDVDVRYPGVDLLHGVDVDLGPGDQVALTGRSGSGKTTLLLVLAGLVTPTRGSVSWPGLSLDPRRRRWDIGMVFQAPSLMAELSALQNVTLPLRLRGETVDAATDAARQALSAVQAADLGDALPAQLSGGQQQRVAVARALAGRHRLVLADEPTGSLDRAHAREVVAALRQGVAAADGALLMATHDPDLAAQLAGRLVLGDDRLVGAGSA